MKLVSPTLQHWINDRQRATFLDMVTPRLEPAPPVDFIPEHVIDRRAANGPQLPIDVLRAGSLVADMRTMPRKKHYDPRERFVQNGVDFGKFGWFRDNDPRRNMPIRSTPRGTIPWPRLTGILLHITAVDMHAARFLGVPAQLGVAREIDGNAAAVLMHAINTKCWHAHAANRFTLGIEVSSADGTITDAQIETLRALIRYAYTERQRNHAGRMVIMAHRQSHKSRGRDPGAIVWQQGAVWAMREFGLELGPVVGSGRSIPAIWWGAAA